MLQSRRSSPWAPSCPTPVRSSSSAALFIPACASWTSIDFLQTSTSFHRRTFSWLTQLCSCFLVNSNSVPLSLSVVTHFLHITFGSLSVCFVFRTCVRKVIQWFTTGTFLSGVPPSSSKQSLLNWYRWMKWVVWVEMSAGEDREILRSVWDGRLPLCLRLSSDDVSTAQQPDCYYLLVPRVSYFPVVLDKARAYFNR